MDFGWTLSAPGQGIPYDWYSVRWTGTSVAQPLIALKRFRRVALAPGESQEVEFVLTAEHLRMLDEEMRWVVESGLFRVMVGASSKDIRLRGEFALR